MQRFQGNRRGTWKVEPRREELRVVEINPGTVPLHTAADVHFRAAERCRAMPSDAEYPFLIKWCDFLTRTDAG
jgi:hypothetical protein